jgi:hypothetical protein
LLLGLFYFCHDSMYSILRELSPRVRPRAAHYALLPASFV